jgi:hypothetical protein
MVMKVAMSVLFLCRPGYDIHPCMNSSVGPICILSVGTRKPLVEAPRASTDR